MKTNNLKYNEVIKDVGPLLPLTDNLIYKGYDVMANQTIAEMFQSGNLKDIPGYEGLYAVSKDGRIWSYPKRRNHKLGKWMRLQVDLNTRNRLKPYETYTVALVKDGGRRKFKVHRLVAITYIPNPSNLPQVNHKDGKPLKNGNDNLEWATGPENMLHAVRTGLLDIHSGKQDGTRSRNGKMTGAMNGMKSRRLFSMTEADCIRKIHEVGKKSCRAISIAYQCSGKTIENMCNYKTYLRGCAEPL
jgi:hypothetical protein